LTRPSAGSEQGLELARLADLPPEVLTEAARVTAKLSELATQQQQQSRTSRVSERRKALLRVHSIPRLSGGTRVLECLVTDRRLYWKLRTQLTQALDHSTLPEEELLAYIGRFQTEIAKVFMRDGASVY